MVLSSKRRKKLLLALGLLAWLLMLGGISYYLCLPDLDEVSQKLRAIREDSNLTLEEKIEKSREIFSKLTPAQGRKVFQNDLKKMTYERNAEMQKFLKLSPEEQVAYVKKRAEERKQLGQKGGFTIKAPQGGDGGAVVKGGGGPGGKFVFVGPPGGLNGKPSTPSQIQRNMLDNFSPETRAGTFYQRGLSKE